MVNYCYRREINKLVRLSGLEPDLVRSSLWDRRNFRVFWRNERSRGVPEAVVTFADYCRAELRESRKAISLPDAIKKAEVWETLPEEAQRALEMIAEDGKDDYASIMRRLDDVWPPGMPPYEILEVGRTRNNRIVFTYRSTVWCPPGGEEPTFAYAHVIQEDLDEHFPRLKTRLEVAFKKHAERSVPVAVHSENMHKAEGGEQVNGIKDVIARLSHAEEKEAVIQGLLVAYKTKPESKMLALRKVIASRTGDLARYSQKDQERLIERFKKEAAFKKLWLEVQSRNLKVRI